MARLGDDFSAAEKPRLAPLERKPVEPAPTLEKSSTQGIERRVPPTGIQEGHEEYASPRADYAVPIPQVEHGEYKGPETSYRTYLRWQLVFKLLSLYEKVLLDTAVWGFKVVFRTGLLAGLMYFIFKELGITAEQIPLVEQLVKAFPNS